MAIKNKRKGPTPLAIDGEEWKVLARQGKTVEAVGLLLKNHRSRTPMKILSVAEAKRKVLNFQITGE